MLIALGNYTTIRLSKTNIMYASSCTPTRTLSHHNPGLPPRMVSLRFCDYRRPLSRTLRFPAIYCHHFRSGYQWKIFTMNDDADREVGPRFALVGLWYVLTKKPGHKLPRYVAYAGIFRSLTCGGWTYITSTDDHDWHDIFMISYLVATLPWTLGCLALSPKNPEAIKWRRIFAASFFATLVPLVYFFIQHKVHKVAGGKS